MTGIAGFVFAHPALFIAGNLSKKGAVKMAHLG
jgi:uncharacterized UPF0160 family protein